MIRYALILVAAFFVAAGLTPLIKRLAVRWGLVDAPSVRKIHKRPIPLMGGVAIYVGFVASLALFGDRGYVREVFGIVAGASLCSVMGLWDDRNDLSPGIKLLVQIVAALLLVMSGVRVRVTPFGWLDIAITLLWVVGITNALNLMDNMDGLSAGVAAIASVFFLLIAAMNGQYLVGAMAASLAGASIGFLVYNVNPASIFMGDSGSLFLGFVLAAVGVKLRFPENTVTVTWLVPVVTLGLPIFDTTLVFISRLLKGKNPLTTPGKDHISHRLVMRGASAKEAVLTLYLAGCGLGVLAVYLTQSTPPEAYALAGVSALALGILMLALLRHETSTEQQKEIADESSIKGEQNE